MFQLLLIVLSVSVFVYVYLTKNMDFWKKRGIFYISPMPIIGNIGQIVLFRKPIGRFLEEIYREHTDKPYVGIFLSHKPCLVVRDVDLVQRILNADFQHFNKRVFTPTSDVDQLGGRSLFAVQGSDWKIMRAKVSPGFTSKKLKQAFKFVVQVGENLERKLGEEKTINAKALSASFTTDVLSTAVFGIEGHALDSRKDLLMQASTQMFNDNLATCLKSNLSFLTPQLLTMFGIPSFPNSANDIIRQIVWKMAKLREEGLVDRDDFFSTLLQLRKKGGWTLENGEQYDLEGDNLVAQFFVFLTAGFDTMASSILFCMYELAKAHDVQDCLRREIHEHFPVGSTLEYESIQSMTYLDMVIHESLRMHPAFPFVDRTCTMDYKLPDSSAVIPKGTFVLVPMLGIQNDEKYWPDPKKFDPERFRDPANKSNKAYFPFSTGPRKCIGQRFSLLQLKVCIVFWLRNYMVSVNPEVPDLVGHNPKRFNNYPSVDILLDVVPL